MLFPRLGRSVWEKTVPLVLSTALGLWPRAQFFPTSCPVNNIYICHTCLVLATQLTGCPDHPAPSEYASREKSGYAAMQLLRPPLPSPLVL